MNILFIGNSYTYYNDMPMLFQALANDNGKDVTVCSVTRGGRTLFAYRDSADEATRELDAVLSKEQFDVCFIQEQSVYPIAEYDRFIDGLECVIDKAKGSVDAFILYATWGRKTGSDTLTQYGWTNAEMTKGLADAYDRAAARFGAAVSHVGLNFFDVYTNYSEIELYDPDMTHPSYQGSCLAALTHYYTLFHEFPENTTALTLTPAELAVFRDTVCT